MTEKEVKLTKNQGLVLSVLNKSQTPLSAYTILDELRDEGLRAPLQVYRALDKLLDLGKVHRLESMNAFVACVHEHHHQCGFAAFAICDECGSVSEFDDDILTERLELWSTNQKFTTKSTTVEIRGLCQNCTS